jgi:ethylmalonyl-CoA mutase
VNSFTETAPSPLAGDETILRVDPAVEAELKDDVAEWRSARDETAVVHALDDLRAAASSTTNVMPATIAVAHAGGTTGEWAGALREVFGEYRAPTGVSAAVGHRGGGLAALAERLRSLPGGPPRLLVAKPGLDGHSNGAEQVAVAARDAGMEVVYQGIRLTPEEIAAVARDEDVDVVGISILSGSHLELVPEVLRLLGEQGVDAAVVVGGIIPAEDQTKLESLGVAAVYTPKDFQLTRMMEEIAALAESRRSG